MIILKKIVGCHVSLLWSKTTIDLHDNQHVEGLSLIYCILESFQSVLTC